MVKPTEQALSNEPEVRQCQKVWESAAAKYIGAGTAVEVYGIATADVAVLKADRNRLVQELKSAGATIRGSAFKCPFHDDRKPSGSIFTTDGVWFAKCHGCGFFGDVIDVLRRAHSLDFGGAVQRLGGETAYVGDDYDDTDLVWHSRARVGDWTDTCRALADLIAESETGVNRGYALPDGQAGENPSGERNDPTRGQKPTKQRMKRQIAEPLIAQHLTQRPHDAALQIASRVGCSIGVVAESKAWKLNQQRLKITIQQGIDPKAVKLDERAVNAVGGGKMRQLHDSRQQADDINDKLDKAEQVLFQRIGVYETQHPQATPEQAASAIGCTAGDVERRQATLNRLVAEQGEDQLEDVDVEDPGAQRGKRRKWVPKRV